MCFDKRCNGEGVGGGGGLGGREGGRRVESAEEDERRNKMASVAEGRRSITLLFFAIRDI